MTRLQTVNIKENGLHVVNITEGHLFLDDFELRGLQSYRFKETIDGYPVLKLELVVALKVSAPIYPKMSID